MVQTVSDSHFTVYVLMAFWVGQFFVLQNCLAHCVIFGIPAPSPFLHPSSSVLPLRQPKMPAPPSPFLNASWGMLLLRVGNCSKCRELRVGSLRKEERKGHQSRTLRTGTGFGNNLRNIRGRITSLWVPFSLCTYLLTPREIVQCL